MTEARVIRAGTIPTPLDLTEGAATVLPEAPTIRRGHRNGGVLLTCPAEHTFWYFRTPAAEVLAPWIVAHELHEGDAGLAMSSAVYGKPKTSPEGAR